MLEAYTTLGYLAAHTSRVELVSWVTAVVYREPGMLAKLVSTLDVLSEGRAWLGIGAAWNEPEARGLGLPFPPTAERFERLEEALQICRAMFRSERPTIEGKHYRVKDVINSPAPITPGGPPIMIGGQGEKKTLRLMAQHAEMANFTSGFDELPHKLAVLAAHCADVGRDPSTINKTPLCTVVHGSSMDEAIAMRNAFLKARGLDFDTLDEATQQMVAARLIVGDADAVGEQVRALMALGLDGITCNLPANGHDPDAVAATVQTLVKAVG
jgi:alkanesulfonate monooxygenase